MWGRVIGINGNARGLKMQYTTDPTRLIAEWDCVDAAPWAGPG